MPKGVYNRIASKSVDDTLPQQDTLPSSGTVRLVQPYGFIDEYGQNRIWQQGEIVGDPAQVSLLMQRGAALDFLE